MTQDIIELTDEDFRLLQHLHYDYKSDYEKYGYGKIISKFLQLQPQILENQKIVEKIKEEYNTITSRDYVTFCDMDSTNLHGWKVNFLRKLLSIDTGKGK